MVSSQIIRGCLEQLKAITRIEFCVLDTAGGIVAQTEGVNVSSSALDMTTAANWYQSHNIIPSWDETTSQFYASRTDGTATTLKPSANGLKKIKTSQAKVKITGADTDPRRRDPEKHTIISTEKLIVT